MTMTGKTINTDQWPMNEHRVCMRDRKYGRGRYINQLKRRVERLIERLRGICSGPFDSCNVEVMMGTQSSRGLRVNERYMQRRECHEPNRVCSATPTANDSPA